MITTPHDVYSQTRPLCGVTVIQRGEPSGVDIEHVVDPEGGATCWSDT